MKPLLLSLPIIITLLLSLKLLMFPKNKSLSSKILSVFFFFFCIVLFAILFQYLQEFYSLIKDSFYLIEFAFYAVMLALPITVYFYVISLTDYLQNYNSFEKVIVHFFLPIQSVLFNAYYYLNVNEATYKSTEYTNFFSLKVTFILLNVYYISKAIIVYRKHRIKVNHILSFDKGISLLWIVFFLIGYVLFVFSFFLLNPNSSPYVVYIPLVLILIYYFFQRNKQITTSLISSKKEVLKNPFDSKALNSKKVIKLKNQLLGFMDSNEPFLKNDLTIYQLAKMLQTNSKYISFIINNEFNQNFAKFINSYRVKYAKEILHSEISTNYTIEAIAEMAGFNSKSAFNNAFKQMVGKTPSQFKKEIK